MLLLLVVRLDELLGFREVVGSQLALHFIQALDEGLIFFKHLVVALGHRTGDDERRTCIVNQHRVYLIDNSVVVGTLHEVFGTDGHIVAQVVETKFIVRTKGDVGTVGTATSFAVGPMLVDAVDTKTVEHIERPHPFGVTLGQIVVDRHHVNTIARKSIEEDRKGGHKGLSFTRCHFGNLAFVENHATEQLNIVVNHVPLHVVASGHPVIVINGLIVFNGHKVVSSGQRAVEVGSRNHHLAVLGKAASRTLHDGEGFIHHLVELRLQSVEYLFL